MRMIHVTRINHVPLVLNSDLIEHLETTPDPVVECVDDAAGNLLGVGRHFANFVEFAFAVAVVNDDAPSGVGAEGHDAVLAIEDGVVFLYAVIGPGEDHRAGDAH